MASSPRRVYWDTCVFIDLFKKTEGRYARIQDIYRRAERGDLVIVTSMFTLAELSRVPNVGVVTEEHSRIVRDFLERDEFSLRQLDRETSLLAHDLARKHNIMAGDAVHLATAIKAQVPVLYTFDCNLKRRGGMAAMSGAAGDAPHLRVEEPPEPPPPLPPAPPPLAPLPLSPSRPSLFDPIEDMPEDEDEEG